MRMFMILIILAVIFMGVFLTACDDDDIVTNPEDANWSIIFLNIENGMKDTDHYVTISWVGDESDYVEPYSISLWINDAEVPLDQWNSYWMGETKVAAGVKYDIRFEVDNIILCDTYLKIVNEASALFPEVYNPNYTTSVYWSLPANNMTQVATVSSFDNSDSRHDTYENIISSSSRSFIFPANAVDNFGDMTSYTLDITQMNIRCVNNVLLNSSQSQFRDYGYGHSSMNTQEKTAQFCMRMNDHIR